MNKKEVGQLLFATQSYYPTLKINDMATTVNLWHAMLVDENYNDVMNALKQYIKTKSSPFAPSIGQLLELVSRKTSDYVDESVAWSQVMKAIGRSSYYAEEEFKRLPYDVQKAVGTSSQLRQWSVTADLNMSVESSNFYKRLSSVRERMKDDKIMGVSESVMIEEKKVEAIEMVEEFENVSSESIDKYVSKLKRRIEEER